MDEPITPLEGTMTGPTVAYVIPPSDLHFVNDGTLWAGDELLPRVPKLAICQNCVSDHFELLFCDYDWETLATIDCESLATAREAAENFYPGLSRHWVDLQVTKEQADHYMRRLRARWACSFCGRTPAEHDGTQLEIGRARICEECIRKFHAELEEK